MTTPYAGSASVGGLGSSVACPRGAGRRLRRRITCRCAADWRMSPRVTCPSTKSCTAGTDSRVHALWRPRCLWQVTRLVGGDAEDRAEDLRADAGGGPSCGWRPTGASAAEVDPLQAQAIVEESVDCVMGAESAGCYDKEWFHEADSVPVDQACKGTSTRHLPDSERRIVSPDGCTKSRMPLDSRTKRTNSIDGTMVATDPEVVKLQEVIRSWMTEFVSRSWDVIENGVSADFKSSDP